MWTRILTRDHESGVKVAFSASGGVHSSGANSSRGGGEGLIGLAASCARSVLAKAFARKMRTGQVDINGGGFNLSAPFGGYKQSGNGRELGAFGLEEFLEVKSLQLPG